VKGEGWTRAKSECHDAQSAEVDKKSYEAGDLYRWSSLRSAYVAEANVNAARGYLAGGWDGWYEMVGSVPAGIGIRGSVATRSSLAMGFFTVHSAGDLLAVYSV